WPSAEPAGGGAFAGQATGGPPPATVTLDRAISLPTTPSFTAPGDIVAERDSIVAAEVAGRVQSTLPVGTFVDRGSVVAVVDDRDARMAVERADAEIERLQAQLVLEDTRLNRFDQLIERGFVTRAQMDESSAGRDQIAAQLASARIAREAAALNLTRTRIRSPFAGQVAERMIEVGEYATAGREITRVVGREDAEARARIPISVAGDVRPGRDVIVTIDGQNVDAKVRAVIETGDEISRTLEVRASLPISDIRMGSAISMTVPTGATRDALTVPRDALVLRESGVFVYVVDPDTETARRVDVEVGEPQGDRIAVNGGVADGDLVVVRGGERLRDGQQVAWTRDRDAEDGDA
ncbi:MAG: efflux RND transporter periplasmic adaptor subunit, partial [Pseudomonadota bacterium]